MLLCYEVTRDLPLVDIEIDTPLAHMKSAQIAGKKLVFAPVLRAGVTFAEGMLDLVPTARIAHIGLYREPETFTAVEYFFKAPSDLHERLVIVISPVLATGNTAVAAVDRLKERGATEIRQVCLIGAPEGVEPCAASIPTFRSGSRRSTKGWTTTATSCRASAMPATAPTARGSPASLQRDRLSRQFADADLDRRKIGREILDVLVGQRRRDHRHRVVLSHAGFERLQLRDEVGLGLAGDVRRVRHLGRPSRP